MNLQTLAFIANMDSLFTNHREPLIDVESQILADYQSVKSLLEQTYSDEKIAEVWKTSRDSVEGMTERKNLVKSIDFSFHQQFKKMHDSFKVVREYYTKIVPEIDPAIYVNSLSSVMSLVDLYSVKSEMLRRDQGRMFNPIL